MVHDRWPLKRQTRIYIKQLFVVNRALAACFENTSDGTFLCYSGFPFLKKPKTKQLKILNFLNFDFGVAMMLVKHAFDTNCQEYHVKQSSPNNLSFQ